MKIARMLQDTSGIIKPTSGAMESISSSQRAKVRHTVEDIRWFMKWKSDLSAYKILFPALNGKQRKDAETVRAIWSLLDSKERARLKKVGEQIKNDVSQQETA